MLLATEEILVGIILPADMDGTDNGVPKGATISVAWAAAGAFLAVLCHRCGPCGPGAGMAASMLRPVSTTAGLEQRRTKEPIPGVGADATIAPAPDPDTIGTLIAS